MSDYSIPARLSPRRIFLGELVNRFSASHPFSLAGSCLLFIIPTNHGPFTRPQRRGHPECMRERDSCGQHGPEPGAVEGDAGDVGEGD